MLEAFTLPVTWWATLHLLPRTKLGRTIFLQPPTGADLDETDSRVTLRDRVGTSGRVLTPLRPSGMIDVAGSRVEAMAESGLIGVGALVTVVAIRSGRVVVRED